MKFGMREVWMGRKISKFRVVGMERVCVDGGHRNPGRGFSLVDGLSMRLGTPRDAGKLGSDVRPQASGLAAILCAGCECIPLYPNVTTSWILVAVDLVYYAVRCPNERILPRKMTENVAYPLYACDLNVIASTQGHQRSDRFSSC